MHLLCDVRLFAMERPQNELTQYEMYVIICINKGSSTTTFYSF